MSNIAGKSKVVTSIDAVVIRADGTREDLGTIATQTTYLTRRAKVKARLAKLTGRSS